MSDTASLASLPSTRRAILESLKKRGEARAEELGADLQITASAVRQHLGGLVASGFVSHREIKGQPGRPKHLYFLTEVAEALFPNTYRELANELLSYIETDSPEMVSRLFDRRRDRRIERAAERVAGKTLEDQVAEVAAILDEDGYLATWERRSDDTFVVTEHNCAVLGVARQYGQACSSEIEFLRSVLPGATVERTSHIVSGAHRCAYLIAARP